MRFNCRTKARTNYIEYSQFPQMGGQMRRSIVNRILPQTPCSRYIARELVEYPHCVVCVRILAGRGIYLFIYLFIYLSIYLFIYLFIYLSICLFIYLSSFLSMLPFFSILLSSYLSSRCPTFIYNINNFYHLPIYNYNPI